ncbi:MAG: DUF1203 domain-containing protein [Ilumatobacteraceae bacterium]|jgi:NAD(P)-dependent dehydrogenase (short-subunit alcohol dehydrogenase family)|nr:DUF1203 domain-containing protein [Ilumatobacteraceae bacterium]
MSFRIEPLPVATANRLREAATLVRVADEWPGAPCRACLRDAEVGDELVLVSFDPFDGWDAAEVSPYRSPSPIYLHRRDCSAEVDSAPIPDQLARRVLSVRAFDDRAMMLEGCVVDGADLATTLEELSERAGVARILVHNAGPGCFAAKVDVRPTSAAPR